MVKYRMYSSIHLSDFLSMYYVLGIGDTILNKKNNVSTHLVLVF